MRVGIGFDIHPFGGDRPLVLAGVTLDGPGLQGHSDADVVAHAVADALLGAAGLGDIGEHFSDTDPQWAGADSMGMLRHVVTTLLADYAVANVDCSVLLEVPKLAPYKAEMAANLAAALHAPASVKAKRGEGLGAIGRGEGIACVAVALLEER